ncbi:MAG: cyclic nucleotide-binding domain-containing protein [candidate division Zixibacteria bacterium]|nr:cyclic nucleotide-binding domain-containing protein [candidate division Zixibacteria bacterium]
MITTIEKVLFLQDIDLFESISTQDLAHIAAITHEVTFSADSVIYKEGEGADSMFIVIDGRVKLHKDNTEVMTAGPREAFGTWALYDDEPRMVTATALDDSRLLKIDKEEFLDLLADHVQIIQSLLQTLAKRLKKLLGRVGMDGTRSK